MGMKKPEQASQLELTIESLVLDGGPVPPGLLTELKAELVRLLSSPEGAELLVALQGGPPRRDISRLGAGTGTGTISVEPNGAPLGKSLGQALYQTLEGSLSRSQPKERRS